MSDIKRLSPDPDLEGLIRKLNASARETEERLDLPAAEGAGGAATRSSAPRSAPSWALAEPTEEGDAWLGDLLAKARKHHASDLLLAVGTSPVLRINGRLESLGSRALSAGAIEMLCAALVPSTRRDAAMARGAVDFSIARDGLGRFRCNVHRAGGTWAAAVRVFPDTAMDLEQLNLPPVLERFTELEQGLVLVTGPTGCGKSTTLAAMVRRILARRRVHVITIEDPVEYEHEHGESVVEHIEIGRDVASFPEALRSALRQDPDVLLIGEMRDLESVSIAITAAETGHLVLSTLHTGDAPQTLHRILDIYPANQMDAVRIQLSISLAGIVSQQLLPRSDDRGRVPAVEVLLATPAVRNLIRQGKIELIRSQLTLERNAGMLGLDRSLARLAREGIVDEQETRLRARVPSEYELLLKRD